MQQKNNMPPYIFDREPVRGLHTHTTTHTDRHTPIFIAVVCGRRIPLMLLRLGYCDRCALINLRCGLPRAMCVRVYVCVCSREVWMEKAAQH